MYLCWDYTIYKSDGIYNNIITRMNVIYPLCNKPNN